MDAHQACRRRDARPGGLIRIRTSLHQGGNALPATPADDLK
ncbi:hypothetical protein [Streptomyces cadmiisoli]